MTLLAWFSRSGMMRWIGLSVAVAAVASTAACGSAAAPTPAPKTAPASGSTATAASSAPAAPPASGSGSAQGSKAPTPVLIAVPVAADAFSDLYVAKDLGFFAKQGLDVTIKVMKMPVAMAALIKGSIQFIDGAGSGIRAAETGLPVRVINITGDHPAFMLIGAKGVTKISQLKGQAVAMKSPQEALTAVGQVLLTKHGLPPGSYKYLNGGDTPEIGALLSEHKVAAAMLESSAGLVLISKGYPELANSLSLSMPLSGLVAPISEIKSDPGLMRRITAALLEGTAMVANSADKSQVLPVMEKNFHLTSSLASKDFDLIRPTWSPSGRPSAAAVKLGFQVDAQALKLAHAHFTLPFHQSQIYNLQFLPKSGSTAS